ncbi:hypothetical protein Vau01_015680 [Virgisporangium aurantiacum]|uniref:Uncharacterized protein n=1 Tax=Virgisporangium aurantiacum TaxID=175570 RepID=A0A8J3Z0I1_9ACTN|nr:hypothetical protein Vau01_015680 [Virgisporangium aurantiacum]
MGRNACSADPSAPPSTRFHRPAPTVDGTGRPDADAAMSEMFRGPTGLIRRAPDVAWHALTADEVANCFEVGPATGLDCGGGAAAAGDLQAERDGRGEVSDDRRTAMSSAEKPAAGGKLT